MTAAVSLGLATALTIPNITRAAGTSCATTIRAQKPRNNQTSRPLWSARPAVEAAKAEEAEASGSGTPGKLGDEKLQAEVRDDIRDDDAEQLAETLNRDLVRPFIDLNFGPQAEYPRIVLAQPDADDVALLIAACEKLVPLGLRVEQSVIRDRLGLPDPDPKAGPEDVLQAPGSATPPQPQPEPAMNQQSALNAELNVQGQAEALLADNLAARANGPMTAWVQQLRKLTEQAADLQELLDLAQGAFPDMDTDTMATVVGQELMRSMLTGRLDAKEEGADGR